jgi:Zn-finger domain-containing protein
MVAFANRGKGQFRTSSDFEDIVYVLDNRLELLHELKSTDEEVRSFLKSEFQNYGQAIEQDRLIPIDAWL